MMGDLPIMQRRDPAIQWGLSNMAMDSTRPGIHELFPTDANGVGPSAAEWAELYAGPGEEDHHMQIRFNAYITM